MAKNTNHKSGNSQKKDGALTERDSRAGRFTDRAEGRAYKGKDYSKADEKMMRAWDTISQNRGAEKRKD